MNANPIVARIEYIDEIPYVVLGENEYWTACKRCWGTGHYSFDGYSSTCYSCNGGKVGNQIGTKAEAEKHAQRLAKARANAARKREEKLAKAQAEAQTRIDAFVAAEPEVAAFLRPFWESEESTNAFIDSLAGCVFNYGSKTKNTLSEKQLAAVKRIMADLAAKPVTEYIADEKARVEFEGEIVYRKAIEGQFGDSVLLIIKVSDTVTVKTFTSARWAFGEVAGSEETYHGGHEVISYRFDKGYKGKFKGTVKSNMPSQRGDKVSLMTRVAAVE